MTPETRVRIASISKPIVAMAVFSAFRTEPDALDAPVREHLPELRDGWRIGDVTLRQLLTHTSGMRDADGAVLAAAGEGDDALLTGVRQEIRLRPKWPPGRAWAYCNPGFRLAGAVLARKHGTTFEKAMQDLVLTPAGMHDSGYDTSGGSAVGHRKGRPQPTEYVRARRPGGGLWSTASDVLSFAAYATDDEGYLAQARRMHSPSAFGHRYGFAWFLDPTADVLFHFGDVAGFQGLLAVAPDHGVAAVVVGNDEHGGALSRLVAFGEITRHTGLPRPRPSVRRLAAGAIRRAAARVLA
jgi:CubicO group peptidase (beta-lactamase class C family)